MMVFVWSEENLININFFSRSGVLIVADQPVAGVIGHMKMAALVSCVLMKQPFIKLKTSCEVVVLHYAGINRVLMLEIAKSDTSFSPYKVQKFAPILSITFA